VVITPFSSWLEGQQARIFAKGTNNPRAFLKSMQVYEAMMRITKEDNALARQMAEELIALLNIIGYTRCWLGRTCLRFEAYSYKSASRGQTLISCAVTRTLYRMHSWRTCINPLNTSAKIIQDCQLKSTLFSKNPCNNNDIENLSHLDQQSKKSAPTIYCGHFVLDSQGEFLYSPPSEKLRLITSPHLSPHL